MAKNTKIEWADATWNPFIGCTKVSPACDNCYAEMWAKRCGRDFSKVVRASQSTFTAPIRWKEPRRVFVCSLSDFFHPDIPQLAREGAMQIMTVEAPQHTYMLLTKRPENIKDMLRGTPWQERLPDNVWLGVTAENQEQADKRIPLLLQVSARVRFVSCEPLLGPVVLSKIVTPVMPTEKVMASKGYQALLKEHVKMGGSPSTILMGQKETMVDWVIVGGESGGKARPMHPRWARSLRDQCAAAGVPFMFKQWGEFTPYYEAVDEEKRITVTKEFLGGCVQRVGKAAAGRLLDGKEYLEIPA